MGEMQELTNANDVVITVGGLQAGNKAKLVVDDFELTKNDNKDVRSGVGNDNPVATSGGNSTYDFSLTLLGEDAQLWDRIADGDNELDNLGLVLKTRTKKFIFSYAYENGWTFSGSDGEDTEVSLNLICWGLNTNDV